MKLFTVPGGTFTCSFTVSTVDNWRRPSHIAKYARILFKTVHGTEEKMKILMVVGSFIPCEPLETSYTCKSANISFFLRSLPTSQFETIHSSKKYGLHLFLFSFFMGGAKLNSYIARRTLLRRVLLPQHLPLERAPLSAMNP